MNNVLAAVKSKLTGSAVSTAVGGRMYLDQAPDGATLPYVVFFAVTSSPHPLNPFVERVDETIVQFSIYSESAGASEIAGIYASLRGLFDDATLTIGSNTHLSCVWQNADTTISDKVRQWAVDYLITKKVT